MSAPKVNKKEDLIAVDVETNVPVYVEKEQRFYAKNADNIWEPVQFTSESNVQMSLYDMNKQIIKQLGIPDEEELARQLDLCDEYAGNMKQEYYLLYGKEINYFTLFHNDVYAEGNIGPLSQMVYECLVNVGTIYNISLTESADAVEIWVLPEGEEDLTCMYLFGYDAGVVEFG